MFDFIIEDCEVEDTEIRDFIFHHTSFKQQIVTVCILVTLFIFSYQALYQKERIYIDSYLL
jgi:hypothetical protein